MSTLKERNEAWDRINNLVNTYVWNMVDIELLRKELEDKGLGDEYFEVLELATKGAKDNYYSGMSSASTTIDSCFMTEHFMFLNWIFLHKDLIEERISEDGLYTEVYYKPDNSLMYRIDMYKAGDDNKKD